jgi:hypothetical protein
VPDRYPFLGDFDSEEGADRTSHAKAAPRFGGFASLKGTPEVAEGE